MTTHLRIPSGDVVIFADDAPLMLWPMSNGKHSATPIVDRRGRTDQQLLDDYDNIKLSKQSSIPQILFMFGVYFLMIFIWEPLSFLLHIEMGSSLRFIVPLCLGFLAGQIAPIIWSSTLKPRRERAAHAALKRDIEAEGFDYDGTFTLDSDAIALLRSGDESLGHAHYIDTIYAPDVTRYLRDRRREESLPRNRPTYGLPGPAPSSAD